MFWLICLFFFLIQTSHIEIHDSISTVIHPAAWGKDVLCSGIKTLWDLILLYIHEQWKTVDQEKSWHTCDTVMVLPTPWRQKRMGFYSIWLCTTSPRHTPSPHRKKKKHCRLLYRFMLCLMRTTTEQQYQKDLVTVIVDKREHGLLWMWRFGVRDCLWICPAMGLYCIWCGNVASLLILSSFRPVYEAPHFNYCSHSNGWCHLSLQLMT